MDGIIEEKELQTTHRLLALWSGKEKEWLPYKQIVTELEKMGVSERTAARYLSTLTRERKLLKEVRGYKRTFYRPSDGFLKALSSTPDWIRIHEESLNRIGGYVMNVMIQSVEETKETTERIANLLEKETENLSQNKNYEKSFEKALFRVFSMEALNEEESQKFVSLLNDLNKTIIFSLSNPYLLGRIADSQDLAGFLDDDIWNIMSAYMNVWAFMYKYPGALIHLERISKKVIQKENNY